MADVSAENLSIRAYAKAKGQNRNGVRRKLRRAGMSGPIDPAFADQAIDSATSIRYKKNSSGDTNLSFNDWEKRHKAAKAVQEERKLAVLDGKLVSREAVTKKLYALQRRNRDAVANIPARISGILAATNSQDEVFRILTEELQQAMQDLCEITVERKTKSKRRED